MPTKSVSTIQAKAPLTGATLLFVSATPINFYNIEGVIAGTGGTPYYIQLLGTATPSSGVTIPLYSRAVFGGQGFSFVYPSPGIDTSTLTNPVGGTLTTTAANTLPVYLAISSTDGVWTSTATATDASIVFEDTYLELQNQAVVGDTVTLIDALTVFADPNPPFRLTQFVVSNMLGAAGYLMLFCYAGAGQNAIPLQEWSISLSGNLQTYKLGRGITFQQCKATLVNGIATPTDYVPHYGCYLVGSSTTQFLTPTAGGNWTIQAFFAANQ